MSGALAPIDDLGFTADESHRFLIGCRGNVAEAQARMRQTAVSVASLQGAALPPPPQTQPNPEKFSGPIIASMYRETFKVEGLAVMSGLSIQGMVALTL
jgi:hypothetical protein